MLAVGKTRKLYSGNRGVDIRERDTELLLSNYTQIEFWKPFIVSADTIVPGATSFYDRASERFFVVTNSQYGQFSDGQIFVTSGSLAGTTYIGYIADFAKNASLYPVSGIVVPTVPENGLKSPLDNAASLNGNICLIKGGANSSVTAQNCADAGGIAYIMYDTTNNSTITGRIFGIPTLPGIIVPGRFGYDMLANSGASVSIALDTEGPLPTFASTAYIAVSKNSAPNTRDDFYFYAIGDSNKPDENPLFNRVVIWPTLAVDDASFYFIGASTNYTDTGSVADFYYHMLGLNKFALTNGLYPQFPNNFLGKDDLILAYEKTISNTILNWFIGSWYPRPGGSIISAHTCSAASRYVSFAVMNGNYDDITHFSSSLIVGIAQTKGDGTVTVLDRVISVPEYFSPLHRLNISRTIDTGYFFNATAGSKLVIEIDYTIQPNCVLDCDTLWCVANVLRGPTGAIIDSIWYEIDVGRAVRGSAQPISLRNYGYFSMPRPDTDPVRSVNPTVDVDKDGNVFFTYIDIGIGKNQTIMHTGRQPDDEPGTLRAPIASFSGIRPHNGLATRGFGAAGRAVRLGTYASQVIDPRNERESIYHGMCFVTDSGVEMCDITMKWDELTVLSASTYKSTAHAAGHSSSSATHDVVIEYPEPKGSRT